MKKIYLSKCGKQDLSVYQVHSGALLFETFPFTGIESATSSSGDGTATYYYLRNTEPVQRSGNRYKNMEYITIAQPSCVITHPSHKNSKPNINLN